MITTTLFQQYGVAMLPVIILALQNRRIGPLVLRRFLEYGETDLKRQELELGRSRRRLRVGTLSRSDRLAVHHYFELERRSLHAFNLALRKLEEYLQQPQETLLEQALLQYETGERFRKKRLKSRGKFPPKLSEKMARAA